MFMKWRSSGGGERRISRSFPRADIQIQFKADQYARRTSPHGASLRFLVLLSLLFLFLFLILASAGAEMRTVAIRSRLVHLAVWREGEEEKVALFYWVGSGCFA